MGRGSRPSAHCGLPFFGGGFSAVWSSLRRTGGSDRASAPVAGADGHGGTTGERRTMHVLVVEPDKKAASALRRTLSAAGHSADIVRDSELALSLGLSGACDIIVLDLQLPGADGLDICRSLREKGVDIPVLALSNLAGVDDRVRGLDAGADDYLSKPFAARELLARIRALARRRGKTAQRDASSGRAGVD